MHLNERKAGVKRHRRGGRFAATATVAALIGGALLVAGPPARAEVTGSVTFDPAAPVAFEPVTGTIDVVGCPADSQVSLSVTVLGSTGMETVLGQQTVQADSLGSVTAVLDPVTAVPGALGVRADCSGSGNPHIGDVIGSVDVPVPADFTLAVTGGELLQVGPFVLEIAGSGCPGSEVQWTVGTTASGSANGPLATGSATPDASGSWTATVSGEVIDPALNPGYGGLIGPQRVDAACVVDGVRAFYTGIEIAPQAPPIGDPGPREAIPNYTG